MLAGLIRTLGTIIMVWFVFRWLDRMFGGRRRRSRNPDANPNSGSNAGGASAKKAPPKDSKLGDYIDFEEVDD
ncbi:MAG: hypothetical protein CL834_05430 [Crocinitomicaceae bacterium]|jgi:hypothetical protein|nr:hypothetical protein [Crocinitomicaceae bacterium]|tara:strand:+ start:140 stop:358 length:219 start_codon:yes stop_codon:yes gene_type:complete